MLEFGNDYGKILYCEEDDGSLYIDFISVHEQKKGHGTKLMKRFVKSIFNSKVHNSIALIASSDYGVNLDVLEGFYSKFGFKTIQENSFGRYMVKK